MTRKKKKGEMTDEEYEAMRKRALRPFKPSITDDEIKELEDRLREESLKNMKKQKDKLSSFEKEQIKDKYGREYKL